MTEDSDLGKGKTCFIIGPIGDRLEPRGSAGRLSYENATQMWEQVFEPACQHFGLEVVRADKISESGEIPDQIFTYLRDAEVVIADLSGGNANVMYELGLRHTRPDKVTIQIGEHERLPFDVTTIRTIKFKRTDGGLIETCSELIDALRIGLNGGGRPVTATRVWNDEVIVIPPDAVAAASARSKESDDPIDEQLDDSPGTLELLAEGEEAMSAIGETLEEYSAHVGDMTALAHDFTGQAAETQSFAARLTVVKQFADALQDPAGRMDSSSDQYLTMVEKIDGMMSILIQEFADSPESMFEDEARSMLASIVEMCDSAARATESYAGALQSARDLRKLSSLVRPPLRTIDRSFSTIMRGNDVVVSWVTRLRAIPEWVEPTESDDEPGPDWPA